MLLTRLAYEQYMTSRLRPGDRHRERDVPALAGAGDDSRAVDGARLVRGHASTTTPAARRRENHAERAAALAATDAARVRPARQGDAGYLAFMRGDVDRDARLHLRRRAGSPPSCGDDALALRSRLVGAANELALGADGARERLVRVVEEARDHGLDELASTGYSNLAYLDVEQRRLADAERTLEESLRAHRRARHPHLQPLADRRAVAAPARSRAGGARPSRTPTTRSTRDGMPVATFWPHVVAGLVHLRRGRDRRTSTSRPRGSSPTSSTSPAAPARAGRPRRADVDDRASPTGG